MVGSKSFPATAAAGSATANAVRANASVKPVPAAPIKKPRRESASAVSTGGERGGLSMCGVAPHFFGGQLDGGADPPVRHAAAQVATHDGINVMVTGVWIILEQSRCLHDLPGLTVAALRCLRLDPGPL